MVLQVDPLFHAHAISRRPREIIIMPEAKVDAFATLLDICRIPDGMRLYYSVEDIYDTGRTVTLVTYDTTTDQAIFTPIDSKVEIPPSEGAPTRFLETDKHGRVRLRPLPLRPSYN